MTLSMTQEMPTPSLAFSVPQEQRWPGRPALNVAKEVAVLQRTTVNELRAKYADVFGEQTKVRHKEWLVRRIVWRMQALAEGDLSERARRRAAELANDADLRTTRPKTPTPGPAPSGGTKTATTAHRLRPPPAHAGPGNHPPIQGPDAYRSRLTRRIRVRGRGLQVALRRGQGHHRHPLERLPVLRS